MVPNGAGVAGSELFNRVVKGEAMKVVRSCLVSIALCSSFASSLVFAGDCSDALIAESCSCQSAMQGEREQPRASAKGRSKSTVARVGKRAKSPVVTSAFTAEK